MVTSSCVSLSSTRCLRWKARFLERLSRSSGGISPLSNHCRSTTFSWLWVTYNHKHFIINNRILSLNVEKKIAVQKRCRLVKYKRQTFYCPVPLLAHCTLDYCYWSQRRPNILIISSFVHYGEIPLGCGTLWQLWCQSPESGYARCTLPSSHTVNRGGKRRQDVLRC